MRRKPTKGIVTRARQLRDDATKPERWLWSRLRELRQHGEDRHLNHDQRRDQLLAQEGYRVLRIPNSELIADFEQVLAFIIAEAERRFPPPG